MAKWVRLFKDSTTLVAWLSLLVALVGGLPGLISIKNEFFGTRVDVAYNNSWESLRQTGKSISAN